MADDILAEPHATLQDPHSDPAVEDGLASILDEAATVCERLSLDHRISMIAGGEVRDVLSVLHTMLDRAQELVSALAQELASARRSSPPGAGMVRTQVESILAEMRPRQEAVIQGVRAHAEQIVIDLTWRVGMLGEQVEALAASFDTIRTADAPQSTVRDALGAFEAEVTEFLSLFREKAAAVSSTIANAGIERERSVIDMLERAERALTEARELDGASRRREAAVADLVARFERLSVAPPVATIESKPVDPVQPTAKPGTPRVSPKAVKAAARVTVKAPLAKAKAKPLRHAA